MAGFDGARESIDHAQVANASLESSTIEAGPLEARASPEHVCLILYHLGGVETVPLPPGADVVVGRGEPSDVIVQDEKLSRKHARFQRIEDVVFVEDLQSKNGTNVNGVNVQRAAVSAFDEVALGSTMAVVHVTRGDRSPGTHSHARFMVTLDDEATRAKTFARPLALLMLRTLRTSVGIEVLLPRIRASLREVDRIGSYSRDMAEIVLPETDLEGAQALAHKLTSCSTGEPLFVAGVACFGRTLSSAHQLISGALLAVRAASAKTPVALADTPALEDRARSVAPVLSSARMKVLLELLERSARSQATVLLIGETGTGKEVLARMIHEKSPRRAGPFISINCGAIPGALIESTFFGHERGAFTGADRRALGVFEEANGGTLFLDEVGELPASAQAALLRVLENKTITRVGQAREVEIDVRVLAATNRGLEAMCHAGTFRTDLYYRLKILTLELPPLRERTEDIEPLARSFLEQANRLHGTRVESLSDEAVAALERHRWPGNVRELKNVIERAAILATTATIGVDDLDVGFSAAPQHSSEISGLLRDPELDLREKLLRIEVSLIRDALAKSGGNQTEAARLLGLPVRTLNNKLRTMGIHPKGEAIED